MKHLIVALLAIVGVNSGTSAAPTLTAPADISVPSPDPILVSGLAPDQPVDLESRRVANDGSIVTASATFRADKDGVVDTSSQAPLGGSYRGIEPLGLFWSATKPLAAPTSSPAKDMIEITLRSGGKELAAVSARTAPDPTRLVIEEKTPFAGAIVVRPDDRRRHPVLIVLGGSEGGDSTARTFAPFFAAQGYLVVGLPYYEPDYGQSKRIAGLPKAFTDIPVDRLVAVRAWLAGHPNADVRLIGLWGASKGAEFAAIAAARYDWLKAVVLIVPSDVVWEGWGGGGTPTASFAMAGKPLAFVPYLGMELEFARLGRGEPMELSRAHRAGRAAYPERVPAARIAIDRFAGAVMVVGGRDDRIWPSAEMAEAIAQTRAERGLPTVSLVYDRVGHALAGPGTEPAGGLVGNGGEASAIARARIEAWAATARFLARNLPTK